MKLSVRSRLEYHFEQPSEVLLLVEAAHSPDQKVLRESLVFDPPIEHTRIDDPATGERRVVFTGHGRLVIDYSADVELLDRVPELTGPATVLRDLPGEALPYLRGSRYCPSDRFEHFVEREFGGLQGGEQVVAIIDWIRANVDYRHGVSSAQTTAEDTFTDRCGVCRDFTHLALSLLRASNIPARAVSAYAFKLEPPDFHAVVEVWLGGRWRLIDVTGLSPAEGLVRIAVGRDAADIAFMTIFGGAEMISQEVEVVSSPETA